MTARILFVQRVVLVGLGLLVLRLAHLQLLHGAAFRQMAEHNRLRLVPQPAPRGLILDRKGHRLAASHMVFRVAAVPQEANDRTRLFAGLSPLVNLPPQELERRFREQRSLPFLPATLVKHVSKSTALRIEEDRLALPGIVVESVATRSYPMGSLAAHLLGYLSQPSPEDFPTLKHYGVKPQDLVGRTGLEQELDGYLRGQAGGSLIEVDSLARQVRLVGHREPVPGQSVVLTIDAKLQALVEQQFGQATGACVVLDPQTGELLAMVSHPTFEPEAFAIQQVATIQRLLADDQHAPLRNRATHGEYMPGSIVKLVTAATALEHRVITRGTTITCTGSLRIGDRQFHCWNRDGHGLLTLRDALTVSCNVFFMEVGRRLGLERLRTGFTNVGFGRRTGWVLEELPGHLPFGRRLSEGEVAMLAMGQGEILLTPLQAAVMVSAIANGGWLVEPWVVQRIGEHPAVRSPVRSLGWSKDTLAAVREGMWGVVNDPRGTGVRAHSDRVPIAGKTGTAQTHIPDRPHGWFLGFCPAEHPRAAMAIITEHGGSGGELPAMMAKVICEHLLENTKPVTGNQ